MAIAPRTEGRLTANQLKEIIPGFKTVNESVPKRARVREYWQTGSIWVMGGTATLVALAGAAAAGAELKMGTTGELALMGFVLVVSLGALEQTIKSRRR